MTHGRQILLWRTLVKSWVISIPAVKWWKPKQTDFWLVAGDFEMFQTSGFHWLFISLYSYLGSPNPRLSMTVLYPTGPPQWNLDGSSWRTRGQPVDQNRFFHCHDPISQWQCEGELNNYLTMVLALKYYPSSAILIEPLGILNTPFGPRREVFIVAMGRNRTLSCRVLYNIYIYIYIGMYIYIYW